MFYEVNVHYGSILKDGTTKKVNERFLCDALSFSAAEIKIIDAIKSLIGNDYTVKAVKESNISEIFYDEKGDKFYRVKAAFITLDEKSGVEKKSMFHYLVQAIDFRNALENFLDGMKGTMSDFEIVSIVETKIMDVFETEPESKK